MNEIINVNNIYDIFITNNFNNLNNKIKSINKYKRIAIITDHTVKDYYLKAIKNELKKEFEIVVSFYFHDGEDNKNLDTVKSIYEFLSENTFCRNDLLIALGGGVVGDITGFAAATYLRGIDFIQIPTTLLSQVDSSIGGKTGVDFENYKNIVGAFYQPKLVYINVSTLQTLNRRQFLSGMGEVIKYALIMKADFFKWLEENCKIILNLNEDAICHLISVCCNCKRDIVQKDPYEKSIRAILNYGHTIGHAVEKEMNFSLLHGECVCIGMMYANKLSRKIGYIDNDIYNQIKKMIIDFELPTKIPSSLNLEDIYKDVEHDKKMDSEKIKFILLKKIGEATIEPMNLEKIIL